MSKPAQTLRNDQTAQLSIRRVRSASIGNPYLGLALWLDEFDQALSQQDYACCEALLMEIRQEGYQLSTDEQIWVESRRAALLLCEGISCHRREEYDKARQYYEASRALHQTLGDESGRGQAIVALEELEKQGAGTDDALLESLAANPRVRGDSSRLLQERLETLPLAEQTLVIAAAKQSGYVIPLLRSLSSPDPVVQGAAATALAWLSPGPDSLTIIEAMLTSANWLIRWQALGILHRRFDKDAEEFVQHWDHIHRALAQRLEDGEPDPMVRRQIALLLWKMKDAADTFTLVNLLADSDADVRYAAIKALDALGDGRALLPLRQVQGGRDFSGHSISEAVKAAILHIKQRYRVPVLAVVLCNEITAQEQPVQPTGPFSVQYPPRYCAVTISRLALTVPVICSVRSLQDIIFRQERTRKTPFTQQDYEQAQDPLVTLSGQEQESTPLHQESSPGLSQEQGAGSPAQEEEEIFSMSPQAQEEEGEELLIELVGGPERSDLDFIRPTLNRLLNGLLNIEALLALAGKMTEAAQTEIDLRVRDLLIIAKELITDTRDLIEGQGAEFLETIQPLTDTLQQVFDQYNEQITETFETAIELHWYLRDGNRVDYQSMQEYFNYFRQLGVEHGREVFDAIQPQVDMLRTLFTLRRDQFLAAIQPLIPPVRALFERCRESVEIIIRPLIDFLQNFYDQYEDELLFLWDVLQEMMRPFAEQIQRHPGDYVQSQRMVYEFVNEWREEAIAIGQPMLETLGDFIDEHEDLFTEVIMPLVGTVRTLVEENREEFKVAAVALMETARDLFRAHIPDFEALAAPFRELSERLEPSFARRASRAQDEKDVEQQQTYILFTFPATPEFWSPGEYSVEIALNGAIGAQQAFKIVSAVAG